MFPPPYNLTEVDQKYFSMIGLEGEWGEGDSGNTETVDKGMKDIEDDVEKSEMEVSHFGYKVISADERNDSETEKAIIGIYWNP